MKEESVIKKVQVVLTREQQEAAASLFSGSSLVKTEPICADRLVDYVIFGSAEELEATHAQRSRSVRNARRQP